MSKPNVERNKAPEAAIGARIRTLRMLKGMSQTDLGEALGVTFQQIQKYEKGVNRVAGSRLVQLALLLGSTPDEILTGTRSKGNGAALDDRVVSVINDAAAFKVLIAMSQVPPGKRKAFAEAMMALVKVLQ